MKLFKHGGFSRPGSHYTIPKRWGYVEISREGEAPYLKRWYLWRCKWFSIRIHHFVGPDPDEHLHDHPWNFWSFPFLGSYVEAYEENSSSETRWRTVKWYSHHKFTDAHKVLFLLRDKGVWTLFITGREKCPWGFYTPSGWQDYKTYLKITS